jgi:hypothetical protein
MKYYLVIKHHATKMYGEMEVHFHAFLTSALDDAEWIASLSGRFNPRECALGKRLGGSQCWSGPGGEEKEFFHYPFRASKPVIHPVA